MSKAGISLVYQNTGIKSEAVSTEDGIYTVPLLQPGSYRIEVQVNPAFVRANEVRRLRGCGAKLDAAIGRWARHPMRETLGWMLSGGT